MEEDIIHAHLKNNNWEPIITNTESSVTICRLGIFVNKILIYTIVYRESLKQIWLIHDHPDERCSKPSRSTWWASVAHEETIIHMYYSCTRMYETKVLFLIFPSGKHIELLGDIECGWLTPVAEYGEYVILVISQTFELDYFVILSSSDPLARNQDPVVVVISIKWAIPFIQWMIPKCSYEIWPDWMCRGHN